MAMDSKLAATANNISKNVGSSKVAYVALFIAVIAIVLVGLALLLYVVFPAPPTLSFGTQAIAAGTSAAPTSIVPNMNTLYNVTAADSTNSYVRFAQKTSGYTVGVVYYITNVSTANTITVQISTSNSFTLDPGRTAMMRVDASGNSHRIHFAAI